MELRCLTKKCIDIMLPCGIFPYCVQHCLVLCLLIMHPRRQLLASLIWFMARDYAAFHGTNFKSIKLSQIIATVNCTITLHWLHNDHDGVSNHQPHSCLLSRLFGRRSKKTSKLRVTGLCAGNSPGTGEFPAQMASNAKNVSIWWRHHDLFGLWPLVLSHNR